MIYIRVKEIAAKQGLTVGDVAHLAHIRPTLMLAYWKNPYKIIDTYMLNKLAEALHVPAQELIESVEATE
jgi:transcriptional regulator with XRE-family HTH domain